MLFQRLEKDRFHALQSRIGPTSLKITPWWLKEFLSALALHLVSQVLLAVGVSRRGTIARNLNILLFLKTKVEPVTEPLGLLKPHDIPHGGQYV